VIALLTILAAAIGFFLIFLMVGLMIDSLIQRRDISRHPESSNGDGATINGAFGSSANTANSPFSPVNTSL